VRVAEGKCHRTILVIGTVTASREIIAEMLRVSTEHVHRSRKEPGCISHHVSIDADDSLTLHFTERWESVEALKTHFRGPQSRAIWKRLQELAARPGAMHLYEAMAIKA
jgi:quinol monooxygenase YgiN